MNILKTLKTITLLLFIQTTFAISVSIDPSHYYLKINPKKIVRKTVRVTNTDSNPVNINVYLNDWSLQNGKKIFSPAGTSSLSVANQVSVFPANFSLNPKESQEVLLAIQTAPNQQGGRYGVVFFEAIPDTPAKQGALQVSGRLGCIIYAEVNGTEKKSYKTTDFKCSLIRNKLYIRFKLKNEGNILLNPNIKFLLIDNKSNEILLKKETKEVIALPGGEHYFYYNTKLTQDIKKLNRKKLSLLVTFDFGNDDLFMEEIPIK